MKIQLDLEAYNKSGLSLSNFTILTLLYTFISNDISIDLEDFLDEYDCLVDIEILEELDIIRLTEEGVFINDKGKRLFKDTYLKLSDIQTFDEFVEEYRLIFPTGKKNGSWYWRSNRNELTNKMKKFRKLYPKYTQEEILQATRNYVNSFNDLTRDMGMSLSKYFLMKDGESMILDYLENVEIETSSSRTNKFI